MFHFQGNMSQKQNGNGNGHGVSIVTGQFKKKLAAADSTPESEPVEAQENSVTFRTSDGVALRGMPARIQRHAAVFELFSPVAVPRLSEALADFQIILQERKIYAGRAVVNNIVDAGTKVVCETTLDELCWHDFNLLPALQWEQTLAVEFKKFLNEWRKSHKISPEFKVVVADIQLFLNKLRVWLEQAQMKARDFARPMSTQLEIEAAAELSPFVIQTLDMFIGEFESIVSKLDEGMHAAYRAYFRQHLHSLMLVSPFARRAFDKPLGYAGDYKMVEVMFGSPYQGETIFAKIINVWLLGQLLVKAHINRVAWLERKIIEETVRLREKNRPARILNLGCGPACEVLRFYEKQHIYEFADFTLVDFNQETLEYLGVKLAEATRSLDEPAAYRLVRKSVAEIIRDGGKSFCAMAGGNFDFIYCAGLFDYLADNVCKQLMTIFYQILAPEGLLLATNTAMGYSDAKPFFFSMDYILDWNLIYRSSQEFAEVAPDAADPHDVKVIAEDTGTNLFLEIRKPRDV